jgi:hypothetical protein
MGWLSQLTSWFINFGRNFLTWVYNTFIDLFQSVSNGLADFIIALVSLFPTGSSVPSLPVTPVGSVADSFLQVLNWLCPISFVVSCVGFIAAGMLAYITIYPLAKRFGLLP